MQGRTRASPVQKGAIPFVRLRILSRVGSLDDEALIVYTSGTTGPPKGVVLTVANLLTDADAIADWHGFGVNDRLMCVLPIHHVNGIVVTLITPFYSREVWC